MIAGSAAALATFFVTTTLLVAAASAVPDALGRTGRASRVIIPSLVANALAVGPVYLLGLTGTLRAGWLGLAVSLASLAVLGWAARRRGIRRLPGDIFATLRALVELPASALSIAAREGSAAVFVLSGASLLLAWFTAQTVLEPTWGDWDVLWYHEPMIGFAIQNHGFDMVTLDPSMQKINGYPRLSEMTMLYLGIFLGRWAIDLVNPLVVPLLCVSTYALCRDLGARRSSSMMFGAGMLFVPGIARLVPTAMVDVHAAALLVAASFYACRRRFGAADAALAIVAVTLAMGAKLFLWAPGFLLCVTLLVRILRRRRGFGTGRTLGLVGVGVVSTVGIVACTAVRNYLAFHNPLWPDLKVDVPSLGIHWPGTYVFDDPTRPLTEQVNADIPWSDFFQRLYARPFSVNNGHDWQIVDYGLGVAYALVPLGTLATLFGVGHALLALTVLRRRVDDAARATHGAVLRLAVPLVVTVAISPALYIGRYHTGLLPLAMAILCARASRRAAHAQLEALAFLFACGSALTVAWNDRGWVASPRALVELARLEPPARYQVMEHGSAVHPLVGEARERELGPGDVVVFDRIAYLGLLWNDAYSNRVVWLGNGGNPLRRAGALGAKWVYSPRQGALDVAARAPGSGWVRIGELESERFGYVYRRGRPPTVE